VKQMSSRGCCSQTIIPLLDTYLSLPILIDDSVSGEWGKNG
jgi:hypothetical protein